MVVHLCGHEHEFGLGRKTSPLDPHRMMLHEAISDLDAAQPVDYDLISGPVLNQGATPECVGHASYGSLLCEPELQTPEPLTVPQTFATTIWQQAQLVGQGYLDPNDGTTVHAASRALSDPKNTVLSVGGKPYITSMAWSQNSYWISRFVSLRKRPVILGINWYEDMFHPDVEGLVKLTGNLAGGHSILVRGVIVTRKLFKVRNSWGELWGNKGDFLISFNDLDDLLRIGGEALCPIEEKLINATPIPA